MKGRRELPIEAFVLAGGRSRRMGRDKALLEWGGSPLIERAVQSLRSVSSTVRIVGDREDLAHFAPVVTDTFPGAGPLGGIHAALAASAHDWNVFLPVDLPLLPAGFLTWMLERVALTEAVATFPIVAGLPQPLCAVYHRTMEPALREELTAGRFRTIEGVQSAASRVDRACPPDRQFSRGVFGGSRELPCYCSPSSGSTMVRKRKQSNRLSSNWDPINE